MINNTRFNFRGVELSQIANFHGFRGYIFVVCDVSHNCCPSGLNFRGMKLSRMAIDPQKPRKFNPAKVKAYTVLVSWLKGRSKEKLCFPRPCSTGQ